jgi:hypothetical protein
MDYPGIQVVPEPASIGLFGFGIASMNLLRRRKLNGRAG